MTKAKPFDALIVGAGAAGVGCGLVLQHLGVRDFTVLERRRIGASFARWPREMRFITPSFTGHAFGQLDLNAIAPYTSPAFTLRTEHPTGAEYALYLQGVADHFGLPVMTGVDVKGVARNDDGTFTLDTSKGYVDTRFLIWAAGEFQYPRRAPFKGAEHGIHNSRITRWQALTGKEFVVIGGYESGIDAAIHLSNLGKRVRVLERSDVWRDPGHDPSVALSPFTQDRLRAALQDKRITLTSGVEVRAIEKNGRGFVVRGAKPRQQWQTDAPPVLATGFIGSTRLIHKLFAWREGSLPELTEQDESTIAPGLFLAGPAVRQRNVIFCFIYKFRQRFAIIAQQIGQRLGLDTTPLELYRQHEMFLDDLACCEDECRC
jgi:cation diffusion facilitator CzcD-associated flavoprotein CzcO